MARLPHARTVLFAVLCSGCAGAPRALPPRDLPRVAPDQATEGDQRVALGTEVEPRYTELLAVDLSTVVRLALARNLDVERARELIRFQRGKLSAERGVLLPAFSPALAFEKVDGAVRATEGNLVDVAFHTSQVFVLARWILNPGAVRYELLAARRRLDASLHEERAVRMAALRAAALRYYDLVLAQVEVEAAREALAEAEELSRITRTRVEAGTGLLADEMRARAELASRRQDLIRALQAFYEASLALSTALDLDATVTLAPRAQQVALNTLVDQELTIDELLALALEYREDLESARRIAEAMDADRRALRWRGLGPALLLSGQLGSISGEADDVSGLGDVDQASKGQERFAAALSWELSPSLAGALESAAASEGLAVIELRRLLQEIRGEVVRQEYESRTQKALAEEARHELEAAEEALRLARANLQAGTMTTLDVLHAQSSLAGARSRHATAVIRYDQAQIGLLAALGLLDRNALLEHEQP